MGTDPDATIFHISPDLAQTNYAPGYVLYEGYLTVGTTEDALETTVDLQDGKGRSLASTNEYTRIVRPAPSRILLLAARTKTTFLRGLILLPHREMLPKL